MQSFSLYVIIINLIIGISVFIAAWIIGNFLQKKILAIKHPQGFSTLFCSLAATLVKVGCIITGSLILISTLGIKVNALVQAIGFLSFALSYIFKDLIADFVSGFLILSSKPFTIGQEISIALEKASYQGKVISIDIRYTTLENGTQTILVPNAILFKQPVCIIKK